MSQCTAAAVGGGDPTPVALLIQAASLVPASQYLLAAAFLVLVFLYNFLEFHALGDALRGFRGDPVTLTFDPASEIYRGVVSKCRILHGRYLATPWLASPHFQTAFLNFFGNPPVVSYRRINKNIVLATTTHGGHLAFFEGIAARSLWWVGAVNEFLGVFRSSPYMHSPKKVASPLHSSLESCIDKSPYVNITEDGMVAAMIKDGVSDSIGGFSDGQMYQAQATENTVAVSNPSVVADSIEQPTESSRPKAQDDMYLNIIRDIAVPIKKSINKISRHSGTSMWLLAYMAIVSSWPVVGSILLIVFRKKLSTVLPATWPRR